MKFDTYSLKARIAPAFFTIILPIIIFNHFYTNAELAAFIGENIGAQIAANLTISGILLFYTSELGRSISKNIFEKFIFDTESNMPTTNFIMLTNDHFSDQHKQRIRDKIAAEFQVSLPSREDERSSEENSRKVIAESISMIRKKLHGNSFLLQHNIEYGAMRNAIGGALVGAILSAFNIYFFSMINPSDIAVSLSITTLGIYILLLLFSKVIMTVYGNNYAKILFREFLD